MLNDVVAKTRIKHIEDILFIDDSAVSSSLRFSFKSPSSVNSVGESTSILEKQVKCMIRFCINFNHTVTSKTVTRLLML